MIPVNFSFNTLWFSASLSAIAGLLVAIVSLAVITALNRKARDNAREFIQTLGFSKALKISLRGAGTIELKSPDGGISTALPQVANTSSNIIVRSVIVRNTDSIHPVDIKIIPEGTALPASQAHFLPRQS
jgi:hypothetical protein